MNQTHDQTNGQLTNEHSGRVTKKLSNRLSPSLTFGEDESAQLPRGEVSLHLYRLYTVTKLLAEQLKENSQWSTISVSGQWSAVNDRGPLRSNKTHS